MGSWFGPRIDLWQIVLKTEDEVRKQLFLVSHYLSPVRLPRVRVYSGEAAKYIFGNALADMFRPLPCGQP